MKRISPHSQFEFPPTCLPGGVDIGARGVGGDRVGQRRAGPASSQRHSQPAQVGPADRTMGLPPQERGRLAGAGVSRANPVMCNTSWTKRGTGSSEYVCIAYMYYPARVMLAGPEGRAVGESGELDKA
eukprot:1195931-Prorocentrum_minimum.AAC.11